MGGKERELFGTKGGFELHETITPMLMNSFRVISYEAKDFTMGVCALDIHSTCKHRISVTREL